METFLLFAIPVAVGAGIGFITNVLAIKMLFRPLRAVKVLGITLPFTPGILPRNRGKLARSLGNAVATELLSEDVVRARIRAREFRAAVTDSVRSLLETVRTLELGQIVAAEKTADTAGVLRLVFVSVLRSEGTGKILEAVARAVVENAGSTRIRDLAGADAFDSFLKDVSAGLLENRESFHVALDRIISDPAVSDRRLSDFLPEGFRGLLERALLSAYPSGLQALLAWLNGDEAKASLTDRGHEIADAVFARMPAVQKLFVSLGGYRNVIHGEMPDIVNDLVESLAREGSLPETGRGLAREFSAQAEAFTRRKVGEVLQSNREAMVFIHAALDVLLDALLKADGRRFLDKALSGGENGLGDRTLGDIARSWFKADSESASAALSGLFTRLAESVAVSLGQPDPAGEQGVSIRRTLGIPFPESLRRATLGDSFGIGKGSVDPFVDGISDFALSFLEEKTGEIVRTVDVRKVVEDRINAMDMESLEKIILDVMKEQFFWIDVFGAVLGSLIGVFQAGLSFLLR